MRWFCLLLYFLLCCIVSATNRDGHSLRVTKEEEAIRQSRRRIEVVKDNTSLLPTASLATSTPTTNPTQSTEKTIVEVPETSPVHYPEVPLETTKSTKKSGTKTQDPTDVRRRTDGPTSQPTSVIPATADWTTLAFDKQTTTKLIQSEPPPFPDENSISTNFSTINSTASNVSSENYKSQDDPGFNSTDTIGIVSQNDSTVANETTPVAYNVTTLEPEISTVTNTTPEILFATNRHQSRHQSTRHQSTNGSNLFNSTEAENTTDPFTWGSTGIMDQNETKTVGDNITGTVAPILNTPFENQTVIPILSTLLENQTTFTTSIPNSSFPSTENKDVTEYNSTFAPSSTTKATANYTTPDSTTAIYTTIVPSTKKTKTENMTYDKNESKKTKIFTSTTSPVPTTANSDTTKTTETNTTVFIATSPPPTTTISDSSTVSIFTTGTDRTSITTQVTSPNTIPMPHANASSGAGQGRFCQAHLGITIFVLTKIVTELLNLF